MTEPGRDEPALTLQERAKRVAHANALFQGGHGGRDDPVAVWAYAEDIYRGLLDTLREIATTCDYIETAQFVASEALREVSA